MLNVILLLLFNGSHQLTLSMLTKHKQNTDS